ncbi:hypothetical protein BH11ACT8_BH11ACT8_14890 [soil metagenome]
MRRWILGLAMLLCLALAASACSGSDTPGPKPAPKPSKAKVAVLTYGVFGSPEEIASYQGVVDAYNAQASTVRVELESWPTSAAMMADIVPPVPEVSPTDGTGDGSTPSASETPTEAPVGKVPVPDIYMVARPDLSTVVDADLNVPLFGLLEARNVNYGDGYSRDALEAFSADADLQCMPYSISPMVVYINTDLVDFPEMRLRGLAAPSTELKSWNIEEFRAAGAFATRKKLRTRGLSISPTLSSLAPFLYSGGGQLFDNDSDPKSLDLNSDDNQSTLATGLEVARNPRITLSDAQLAKATPTQWFERGRLGMVEGFRSLTPELRDVPGLHFDVMPMPRVNDDATVGDITGLCIAPGRDVQRAADFLVHVISDDGFAPVAEAGYVVPANLAVARSDTFLQPDRQPANAAIFNAGVDHMVLQPLLDDYDELEAAVDPLIEELFTMPVIGDIGELTAAIDEASRPVLDPDYVPPTETPTDGATSDSPTEGGDQSSEEPSSSATP